jgi:hypothetical protein
MSALATVPRYVTGTWAIDPVNSEVGFTVRADIYLDIQAVLAA